MKIGLQKRQFNKNLKDLMKDKGITNADISKYVEKSLTWVSGVINFKVMPNDEQKMKIAILLGVHDEVIFPEEYNEIYDFLKGSVNNAQVNVTREMIYSNNSILLSDNNMENTKSNKQTIDLCLSVLSEKEKKILSMRLGLNGYSPEGLVEVGQYFGVTRERIRQIEAKAFEKIRQSKYADLLKEINIDK